MGALSLAFGLEFGDLYERDGLVRVDAAFVAHMAETDGDLGAQLAAARAAPSDLDDKVAAQLMVDLAPHVEDFIATLFAIETEVQALAASHDELAPLYACKRLFVQRRAAKRIKADEAAGFDMAAIEAGLEALLGAAVDEIGFATAVMGWLDNEEAHGEALEKALAINLDDARCSGFGDHDVAISERLKGMHFNLFTSVAVSLRRVV